MARESIDTSEIEWIDWKEGTNYEYSIGKGRL